MYHIFKKEDGTSRAPYGARGLKWLWVGLITQADDGRAPYGARGLKYTDYDNNGQIISRRAPYGARGLKSIRACKLGTRSPSRPVWGAWIEIAGSGAGERESDGRAPYGARGLKFERCVELWSNPGVAPRMGRVD